jgi:hypothetical protein
MGGFGSGRYGGRPTVESAVRLDIDDMMQWGGIRAFARLAGEMRLTYNRLLDKLRAADGVADERLNLMTQHA